VLNTEVYHNGRTGLEVAFSENTLVEEVTARDNNMGIHLWEAPSSVVRDCVLEDNWGGGIYNSGADFSTIENNTVTSSSETHIGIKLSHTIDCILTQNTLNNVGFDIQSYQESNWRHVFSDNTINGKPFGYFDGANNTSIDGTLYGQLVLLACENVVVNGGEFNNAGGVSIYYSENCTLLDVEINGSCDDGVDVYRTPGTWIENLVCSEAYRTGIEIHSSPRSTIIRCDSNRSSGSGIAVYYSESSVIQDCRVSENLWTGIVLGSSFSTVKQNWIQKNGDVGLLIMDCTDSSIIDNVVIDNEALGILVITYPGVNGNNSIFDNSIGWNVEGNAYDYGANNTWDNGVDTGNRWADYNGTGYYYIEGEGNAVDRFPSTLNRSDIDGLDEPQIGSDLLLVGTVAVSTTIVVGSLIVYWKRKYPSTE
jgi:parallel beta-helix repeat protein